MNGRTRAYKYTRAHTHYAHARARPMTWDGQGSVEDCVVENISLSHTHTHLHTHTHTCVTGVSGGLGGRESRDGGPRVSHTSGARLGLLLVQGWVKVRELSTLFAVSRRLQPKVPTKGDSEGSRSGTAGRQRVNKRCDGRNSCKRSYWERVLLALLYLSLKHQILGAGYQILHGSGGGSYLRQESWACVGQDQQHRVM